MPSLCSPRSNKKDGAAAAAAAKDDPAQDPALAPLLAISQQALRACKPLWPDPCSAAAPSPPKGRSAGFAFDDLTKDGGKALASTPSGIVRLPNGMVHISVVIPFPGVTAAMLEWWMACFCADSVRYKLWHPTDHIWCGWADDDYHTTPPAERPPTHYLGKRWAVRETVGGQPKRYILHFLDPQQTFHLPPPPALQAHAGIQTILAARVYEPDALRGQMAVAHQLNCLVTTAPTPPPDAQLQPRTTELRCHFWLGDVAVAPGGGGWLPAGLVEGVGNHPWGRRAFAPLALAREVHRHCFEEMSCLAAVLPEAYERFRDAPYAPPPGL